MTTVMVLMAPVLAPSVGALAAGGASTPARWGIVHIARLTPDNTLWGGRVVGDRCVGSRHGAIRRQPADAAPDQTRVAK
jgi:hypothetical protein